MWKVMTTSVIMQTIIVEHEQKELTFDKDWKGQDELVKPQEGPATFQSILHVYHKIRDQTNHKQP
jgi:hypothetical protein